MPEILSTKEPNLSGSGKRISESPTKELTLTTRKAKTYIIECEAIRGTAILLVVIFHCALRVDKASPITPNPLNAFALAGNTGVTLFFVLSGFLLNLPFMAGAPIRPRNFFLKRILRIMPMYFLAVLLGTIYRKNIMEGLNALFFFNLRLDTLWPFGSVWWSLAVEIQFYLLLPLLHTLGRSLRWRWLLLPLLIFGLHAYYTITRSELGAFYFLSAVRDSILTLWPTFLFGAILAKVHTDFGKHIKDTLHRHSILKRGGADLIIALLICALSFVLYRVSLIGHAKAHTQYFDHVIIEAFIWTLFIGAILYLPARTKAFFSNPILVFVGLISYSLYLLHAPVIFFSLKILNNISQTFTLTEKLTIGVIASVAISTLAYYLIEKPALSFKHKWHLNAFSAIDGSGKKIVPEYKSSPK